MNLSRYSDSLAKSPLIVRSVVEGRPESWLDTCHSPEAYTPREVIAHLVLVDRDWGWIARIKKVLDPQYDEYAPELLEEDYAKQRTINELLNELVL